MTEPESSLCGRLTRRKRPCRMSRVTIGPTRFGGGGTTYVGASCQRHMTEEEHVTYQQAIQANVPSLGLDHSRPGYVSLRNRDPACWSWEVIDTDDLYEFGDGKCGICGTARGVLVMDHDHDTGLNRGILCRSCNLREGHAPIEPPSIWTRYRLHNPATILGIEDRYCHPIYGDDIGNIARRANYDIRSSPAYGVAARFAPGGSE